MHSRAHLAGWLGTSKCSSVVGPGRPGSFPQPNANSNTHTETNSYPNTDSHAQANSHPNSDS